MPGAVCALHRARAVTNSPVSPGPVTPGPVTPAALAAVSVGGASGALLRWALETKVASSGFPWTTLTINVAGSALLALLLGMLPAMLRPEHRRVALAALGPGLLGGFTTLSTFSEETRLMVAEGKVWQAGAYVLLSLTASVLAVHCVRHLSGRREPSW